MTTPCNTEDGCGVEFSVSSTGALRADAVLAPLPCQAIQCLPGTDPFPGLFMVDDQSLVQAGISHGWGGAIDLHDAPLGLPILVDYSGVLSVPTVFENESTCVSANVISMVTGREVQYDGPGGAHFRVTTTEKINGIGFFPLIRMDVDLRATQLAAVPIQEARPMGCAAGGRGIPPGGVLTYEYRTYLTSFESMPEGSFVNSPGFTWCYWSITN